MPGAMSFAVLRRSTLAALRFLWTEGDSESRRGLALAVACVIVAAALAGAAPLLLQRAIDAHADTQVTRANAFYAFLAAYVLTQSGIKVLSELRWWAHARADQRIDRLLTLRFFSHVVRLPTHILAHHSAGGLSQVLANAIIGYRLIIQHVGFTILPVIVELTVVVLALASLGEVSVMLLLAATAAAYVTAFMHGAFAILAPAKQAAAAKIKIGTTITDCVAAQETLKYLAAERQTEENLAADLRGAEQTWRLLYRRRALNGLLVAGIFALSFGFLVLIAAQSVAAGEMTMGTLVMVSMYALQMLRPVELIGYAMRDLTQGSIFVQKMLELLRLVPEPQVAIERPASRHQCSGEIRFENVSFAYAGCEPLLKHVSFTAPPRTTLAIVGPSGSGKSTIVRLLLRLFEPNEGSIALGGVPIAHLSLQELRRAIAVVPQDAAVLNSTLAFNIGLGIDGCTRADIVDAATRAHLAHLTSRLGDECDTHLGDRGVRLSGGERQRIAIARAALREASAYVLDEATSSLDVCTERSVIRLLREVSRDATTLVIAHRLSTVAHADKIIVLDGGRICEEGTHHELLYGNGLYARMWQLQQESVRSVSGHQCAQPAAG